MERRSRANWAAIIERWRASGFTAADFAQREGVKKHTLLHWSWRLGRKTKSDAQRSKKRAQAPKTEEIGFVELMRPAGTSGIELVLGNGTIVRVPDTFDELALGRILRVAGGQQ